jgi:hypothetical protein
VGIVCVGIDRGICVLEWSVGLVCVCVCVCVGMECGVCVCVGM